MKLYTDQFNIHALKVFIAKELSELIVDVRHVAPETKVTSYMMHHRLPVLEFENGNFVFSPNNICRYLLEKSGKFTATPNQEKWIEWESTELQPYLLNVLHSAYGSSKCDDKVKSCLLECLSHLDKFLQESPSFSSNGSTIGLAEVVIWSSLYPLIYNDHLATVYLQDVNEIKKWFAKLAENESFKKGVNSVLKGKDTNAFKDSLLHFGPPRLPLLQQQILQTAEQGNEITEEDIEAAHDIWISGKIPPLKQQEHPVLPKEGERNILISSALPYVNNVPHLGNIIGAVLSADVFARYCRLRQYNTFYICGTDEYGTATETKALEENLTPKEICDKYHKLHHEVYTWFDIAFDFFGRTTTDQQTKIAQDIFWKLHNAGYIFQDTLEQLFCNKCQRFLADRYVQGICPFCSYEDARGDQCDKCSRLINTTELKEPKCQVCRETPMFKSSQHLFLDLPKLEPKIKEFLDKVTTSGHWSTTAKVISYAWLKDGLKPRCISRDLKWGTPVPLPGFTNKVFYVWFDAPIGYLSMSAKYSEHWEKWWKNAENVQLYQFMAKDNVPFHSIVFPASQLGTGDNYTTVNHLAAVEYLNYEDSKFSKSRGIGVFGNDAKDTGIPSDIWRFYLLYIRPESQDTVFSWNDLMTKNNSELLNNLGNFINRSLMFLYNNFGGIVPKMELTPDDKFLIAQIAKELENYIKTMENIRLRDGIRYILNISRLGNQHIQANKPWELVKGTDEEKERSGCITGLCANIGCLLSVMIEPYMPKTSRTIQLQLNSPPECNVLTANFVSCLPEGHRINKPSPLFKKIEQSQVDELKVRYAGNQNSPERQMNGVLPDKTETTFPPVGDVETLAALVAEQGEKVRTLKTAKAEKKDIDVEVAKLLTLKKKLALASGQDPTASSGKPPSRKKQIKK